MENWTNLIKIYLSLYKIGLKGLKYSFERFSNNNNGAHLQPSRRTNVAYTLGENIADHVGSSFYQLMLKLGSANEKFEKTFTLV